MEIKIYFGDKPVYLCDLLSTELKSLKVKKSTIYDDGIPEEDYIVSICEKMEHKEVEAMIIENKDFKELKNAFFGCFKNIIACGGLVQNENKDVLFIFRREKWDLPKGKIESGEALDECAKREIEEETGVKDLIFKHKICETFHVYDEKGKRILKTSHWFYFITNFKEDLEPQTEEDITEVKWIPTSEISKPMTNTYATIKSVVHSFFDEP